eukprot:3604633-Prymnesium_polylepis.1
MPERPLWFATRAPTPAHCHPKGRQPITHRRVVLGPPLRHGEPQTSRFHCLVVCIVAYGLWCAVWR